MRSLQKWISRVTRAFAYPNGLPELDHDRVGVPLSPMLGMNLVSALFRATPLWTRRLVWKFAF
jgi:hypothetical protein